jgi:acetyltransferase EpsM
MDIARNIGRFESIAFLDDDRARDGDTFFECAVISEPEELKRFTGKAFTVAVGDNRIRAQCFCRGLASGLSPTTLVHRTAVISPLANIGRGTVLMPGVIVNADAIIGENCIVNTGAIVEHDCQIFDHVHISPRVVLGGGVTVGAYAHIGIGAVVLPGAKVGEGSIVGAGAVVVREAPAHRTVVVVPAKIFSGGK